MQFWMGGATGSLMGDMMGDIKISLKKRRGLLLRLVFIETADIALHKSGH